MDPKLKRYQSDFNYSYCLGVYPTLELITHQPQSVLKIILHSKGSRNQGVEKLHQQADKLQIDIQENDRLVEKLSSRGNTYAIGVFQKYGVNINPLTNHLVLVNPSSMGNLGTIMRTMVGFGYQDLAIVEPAADVFHPKVIRSSMGAIFQVRSQNYRSFPDYWGSHANHTLYPLMTDGKISLPEAKLDHPYALIFGDEASGLGSEYHQYGTSLRIPQAQEVLMEEDVLATDALAIKLRAGLGNEQGTDKDNVPGRTEKLIRMAREKFGEDMIIMIDANGNYSIDGAIRIGKILEEYNYYFFEAPLPWDWHEFTGTTGIP